MDIRKLLITREYKANDVTGVMKKSLYLVFFVILVLFGVLIGKLVYINATDGEKYAKAVLSQQSYSSTELAAQRGTIYDRNGYVFAKNSTIYNVILDPAVITSKWYYYEPTVNALCDIMGYSRADIEKTIEENRSRSYVVYEKNIEYSRVSAFNEAKNATKYIVGVWFEEKYERVYPYAQLSSHVLGFVDKDGNGTYGIEQYYNDVLKGQNGLTYGYFDSELNMQRTTKDAVNGCDLVMTIDKNISDIIQKHTRKFIDETGCENIGVIVMNPNNGELLGMTSNLEYDLNNPRVLTGLIPDEVLGEMTQEEKTGALYKIWRNYCISDTYEPGSTYKTITVASALEENAINSKATYLCEGSKEVGGWKIGCNNKSGHGTITLSQALMKSCNVALMDIAESLGRDRFFYYQNLFGFGKRTGVDIAGEASGIIIPKDTLNVTELATSSFGTTFNVTMIQMAAAYASIVNGGTYYTPHAVKTILNSDGTLAAKVDTTRVKQTVSESTSDFIRDALYLTVEKGTATPAKVAGYMVAGKTGTAQKRPREAKKYVVSFCGFAPVENPEVLVYIVIDEIHDPDRAGSSSPATSMFSSIMEELLPYMGMYPEGEITYHVDEDILAALSDEVYLEEFNTDPDVLDWD